MVRNKVILSILLLFSVLLFFGCDPPITPPAPSTDTQTDGEQEPPGDEEDVPRPEGWTKETHGKKGDPNYEVVFPDDKVNRLDVTISAADWQAMIDNMEELWGPGGNFSSGPTTPGCGLNSSSTMIQAEEEEEEPGCGGNSFGFPDENPVYKPCTLEFEGKTWTHVGIRFKGNSSLQASWRSGSYKFPLRFTFDQFEDEFPEIDNQRFYGFKKVSMSSNYSDSSFLREKVVADIFRHAGVPAARTAFYRVFIDYGEGSKYFGLYTMVEIPDKPLLKSQFSDNGGNLYKPTGSGATFSTYDESSYDKETNEDEGDFSDVRALYDALNASRADAAAWRANLEQTLNVDGFLRWLAVNTTIQNWDTYGLMSQNYYLYNDPADPQLHWMPWDNNMAMSSSAGRPPLSLELTAREVSDRWPLIRYLIDDPVYKAKYVGYVEETITTTFTPERMRPIYKAAHDMIRPYVVGAEGEVSGYTLLSNRAAFDQGLTYLNDHVQNRYQAAQSFIRGN